ncbi:MAG: hypothetical protein A2X61_13465 [Ignavibacteria bacterium GWB2_35_12]|nr:MAG: hypothetical protein A2X63_02905 [Ignavibacteria bacterium GWA2_35_8]OGU39867.1 MAG: hypothetical protein A2X61_13465 [Ignavibacteria bacterium GWB2_35_12]OGU86648.1 MAG: hypothetical protein A2220_13940 [Ignavibacteria bacterium RIFOXYA2_FULL_35_10]OGV21611.1 MAG: hypothetical protein A2475_13870 [Ignavibacteria bacterium RIFOXYC2_FULL_35_21]
MEFFKKFAAIIISSLILIISVFLFLKHIANVSLPDDYEENKTGQINSQVKIYRNLYGIPHIIANNEKDLFFAIGYAHAQDRLWQMDYLRRLGKGRLSEIFGKTSLSVDIFMRAIEIEKTAHEINKRINKTTLELLNSYSNGINYFIAQNKKKLPYEFCVLDYTPDNWSPIDCIIIQRLIALELSVSFWADITNGAIAERLGPIRALELLPSYPAQAPCILDSSYPAITVKKKQQIQDTNFNVGTESFLEKKLNIVETGLRPVSTFKTIKKDRQKLNLLVHTGQELNAIRMSIGMDGNSKGSNIWAIKKAKKTKSPAILANDSHMPLGLPSQWYQIHATCPTINVIGLTIPGIPFIFSGRNNNISWGYSNMNLDDCDFFIEKIDADTNYYFTPNGQRIRFNYVKDTVKIKDSENYVYYRKYSQRSAVLNELNNIKNHYNIINDKKDNFKQNFIKKYCITFNWLGNKTSYEFDALYKLTRAKNWFQFRDAINSWGIPSVNFIYADKSGNIGLSATGAIPIRDKECKPQIPNPGWIRGYNWLGYKKLNDLPTLYNPPKRFVSAANNKLWRYEPNYISCYWENSSRMQRINNLLNLYDEYNSREAEIMQLDVYSSFAKELLDCTIPSIQKQPERLNELQRQALRKLKKWDCLMSQHTASPMLFSQFLIRLIKNTFEDELGENLFNQFISVSNLPPGRIMELVADTVSSSWFDNVRTSDYEEKDYIIQKSFKEAVEDLKNMYGNEDINLWKYGTNNKIELKHILSFNNLIKSASNLEPFESGGSNTTINAMEWNLSEPYKIVSGPSMRFIADMGDTVVYTSIAGGISGDPFSDYYSNQVQLWLNGGYIALPVSKEPGSSFKLRTFFEPTQR